MEESRNQLRNGGLHPQNMVTELGEKRDTTVPNEKGSVEGDDAFDIICF